MHRGRNGRNSFFGGGRGRELNPNASEFVPHHYGHRGGHRLHDGGVEQARRSESGDDSLRTKLSDQLWNETYECMICCERIRWTHAVWSCQLCYSIFHLRCAKRWASSCSRGGQGENENQPTVHQQEWRCPGCQSVNDTVPSEYKCFCGKMKNPNEARPYHQQLVPHTCGELCQKRKHGADGGCPHQCRDPCHPGPCDPCPLTVGKQCLCGKEKRRVRCGSDDFQCGKICGKTLNCGIHQCQRVCHRGECGGCDETLIQECFCGQSAREVICGDKGVSTDARYSCGIVCNKLYACGDHRCQRSCHEGSCNTCVFDPSMVTTCCCGKMNMDELGIERKSCNDPLPTCGNICNKPLPCGEADSGHKCASPCHVGACPVCPLKTSVQCRCGSTIKSIPCAELAHYDADHPVLCSRRCNKKRTCKQHKCGEYCCIDSEHLCTLICGRKLSCGVHTCDSLCHGGKCRPCLQASFEELTCHCGASVIYPPIPCGTRPPACDRLCTRQHNCPHCVTHTCHSDSVCPPCTFLTEKYCYGKHQLRKNIPCYLQDVSCGLPCGQALPCGQHWCNRNCHAGECFTDGGHCSQPCIRPRSSCGHPCATRCHGDSPCPEEKLCEFSVTVSCPCGHNATSMPCFEIDRQISRRILAKTARATMQNEVNLAGDHSLDRYKCLECTEECARIDRNRRFAEALDVKTDDVVGTMGQPVYSDFMKERVKADPEFVLSIEKAFCDLVTAADKSSQTSRSHVFPPMNRLQRRSIHEYASYWRVDTAAYDQEPKRNVVATANKGKSVVPAVLLSGTVQKENTKSARVAGPTVNQMKPAPSNAGTMETLQLTSGVVSRR